MSIEDSIQAPLPTFHDESGNATPREFHTFLQTLLERLTSNDPPLTRESLDKQWCSMVSGLIGNFLSSFSPLDEIPWNAMHEKLSITQTSLEILEVATTRTEQLFMRPEDFAPSVLNRLIQLCLVLDSWRGITVVKEERYLSPTELQSKTVTTAVAILRSLGGIVVIEPTNKITLPHEILRRILSGCLAISNGAFFSSIPGYIHVYAIWKDLLALSPVVAFPLRISLAGNPRIWDASRTDCPEDIPFIKVGNLPEVPSLLTLMLELCLRTFHPPLLAQWYLEDLIRSIFMVAERSLDHLLSPSCATSATIRARALARLGVAILSALPLLPIRGLPIESIRSRLFTVRLQAGPSEAWEAFDAAFKDVVEVPFAISTSQPDVTQIGLLLRAEKWGDAGETLRALSQQYLIQIVSILDKQSVDFIIGALGADNKKGTYAALLAKLDDRQASLKKAADGTDVSAPIEGVPGPGWRELFKSNVQAIIEPTQLAWMDDDDSLSDEQFITRAFHEMNDRFTAPLYNPAAHARESLAQEVGRLSCVLAHPGDDDCSLALHRLPVDTLPVFVLVTRLLLEGPDNEVTAKVYKAVFRALSRTLRHLKHDVTRLDYIRDSIGRHMKNKDRSIRLSAGNSLLEYIRFEQTVGSGAWKRIEPVFAMIGRLFDMTENYIKETTLITLGRIGQIAQGEVFAQDICCLLAQLGQPNPIIKGTAHLQLHALCKHHRKKPYNLVSPYMDRIAIFIISRMCTQPSLLIESSHFFGFTPHDFISVTLGDTLPQLFSSCDVRVLDAISKELNEKPYQLFLSFTHQILAHVFRLQGPGQTNKVLSFILKMLKDTAQSDIDLASVLRTCLVPLLVEIVIVMGHEDPDQAESAREALRKVERSLSSRATARTPTTSGSLLKTHMLGIISHLNDHLQDFYGKRSLEMKKMIVRSLGMFVAEVGPTINNVAPQIMATLQTMLVIPQLADVTLESWYTFLLTLDTRDLGPHVGPTSASLLTSWSSFSAIGQDIAKKCLRLIVSEKGEQLDHYLDDVADIASIPQLHTINRKLTLLRDGWSPLKRLRIILERAESENLTVAMQSIRELKSFMLADHEDFIRTLASGDVFDPMIGHILSILTTAACRSGEAAEMLRVLAIECIGVLGAIDPDRCEIDVTDTRMIMLSNFADETESVSFALHLVQDVLVGAFRSTSDIKYQRHLAYAIQELLQYCKFTPALVNPESNTSIALKVRNRWNSLPKHVLETITPLLSSKYLLDYRPPAEPPHPIYPSAPTYREWIQVWTGHLLTKASGVRARAIFHVFPSIVQNKDVGVAHHLLPHLVLNILISGEEEDAHNIRMEILAVLDDQVQSDTPSAADKKLLSAQAGHDDNHTVFTLLDHLSQWVRVVRQQIGRKKVESRRARVNQLNSDAEEQVLKIDSIVTSIDQGLMARAALQCRAYARALMNFERRILALQGEGHGETYQVLQEYYEHLHEIYAHLDEPDGMEGVSTLILSPSLEHQIRQHESTGRWTSAQSCWEVRLQQSPDNLDFHLGLLRCLRNLGHYDTLRTHVKGVLTRNPGWESQLVGFQVESEWMVGNWEEVRVLVERTDSLASPVLLAQVLLALRAGDALTISQASSVARGLLGAPIIAAGANGYRRSYDAVLDLHVLHELETIHASVQQLSRPDVDHQQVVARLSRCLSSRFESTLPVFRIREPILSMRRIAFGLSLGNDPTVNDIIGRSWLASAKIARKAGHWQTAYSAMLQAQQCRASFSFMENARLVKASGEPIRALQELESSMRLAGILENPSVIDLTVDPGEARVANRDSDDLMLKAKAQILRARWMNESDRYDVSQIVKALSTGAEAGQKWESGQFHYGQYHDQCFKSLPLDEQMTRYGPSATTQNNTNFDPRGTRMNLVTIRSYAKAMRYGSKYIYQTVPRLLTLWLDMGENQQICRGDIFPRINMEVARAIKMVPVYKWFTAFPQIVSRVGHDNEDVHEILSKLISMVIQEYPKQALWLFASVVKSTKKNRNSRGIAILNKLRQNSENPTTVPQLINECQRMTDELLGLCDAPVREAKSLSMRKDFSRLFSLAPSQLIIPLQESLTASLPPTSSNEATHRPFPVDAPTFASFQDEIEIMRSLAKPRKITINGSDGQIYMFLGKPKDDLRKDARLMDFNAIINKLLKSNSESRRRQLHIRTYGVVTLNEECGFIQWVPNTIPVRPVLLKAYERRGIRSWSPEMQEIFEKIKKMPNDKEVAQLFSQNILCSFPPVFHEWFLETFPEPTAWLASRMAYSRTAAVMSMVGFILGLGDRHCENILLDTMNGDVVHVDFNCLFEKGKTLETPELVPFRLTQNLVDGLGVMGVEGVFRVACEVSMKLLRDNKDTLMSVLDAFVHDPLVEWEDEKRKKERNRATVDLRRLAKDALKPIEKKLKGIYTTSRERPEKETSTSSLVQMLIQEATDTANLGRMYPGWTPWH
ncbi:uncharacterized protein FIBRA_00241 [Fibroporia radiculosa]|uniref:non-specific serine/threonine protein kinase n=1 Tax=Fibroporia radiculosa TaxID=599839 RepID=J7RGP6_9APHY|nr:uncharacterized protein FIBRA_00241 [Fibroporia radiculosa]CCL98247.1 predicted protein [Fibroporia radiculosa]